MLSALSSMNSTRDGSTPIRAAQISYARGSGLATPNTALFRIPPAALSFWISSRWKCDNAVVIPGFANESRTVHVDASGDLAYTRGTFQARLTSPDGKPVTMANAIDQFYPYTIVHDYYGVHVWPENMGYVPLPRFGGQPGEKVVGDGAAHQRGVKRFQIIENVGQRFFHPFRRNFHVKPVRADRSAHRVFEAVEHCIEGAGEFPQLGGRFFQLRLAQNPSALQVADEERRVAVRHRRR